MLTGLVTTLSSPPHPFPESQASRMLYRKGSIHTFACISQPQICFTDRETEALSERQVTFLPS